jgi:hypothetical protein
MNGKRVFLLPEFNVSLEKIKHVRISQRQVIAEPVFHDLTQGEIDASQSK